MSTIDVREPPLPIPVGARRGAVLRGAAGGLVLGASWGIVARAWMRLISTNPEFSWSGTLLIIAAAGLVGIVLGAAMAGRRGRHPRLARVIGALGLFPLGIGAGTILIPAVVTGAFALPGPIPSRRVRISTALLPLLVVAVVGLETQAMLLAVLVAAVIGTAGWFRVAFRPMMTVLACAAIGAVVVPLFTDALPHWRAALGAVGYLLLLAPLVTVYAHVVRQPIATQIPSAPADGDTMTKEP